jgi:hypothetical protein
MPQVTTVENNPERAMASVCLTILLSLTIGLAET